MRCRSHPVPPARSASAPSRSSRRCRCRRTRRRSGATPTVGLRVGLRPARARSRPGSTGARRGGPRGVDPPAQLERGHDHLRSGSRDEGRHLLRPGCRRREVPGPGRRAPALPGADRPHEVHRAARRLPDRRHLPVRAGRCRRRDAAADRDVSRRRRGRGLPAYLADRRARRGGHVHRSVRLAGSRARTLRRDRRDRRRRRRARAIRLDPGVGRRGDASVGATDAPRSRRRLPLTRGGVRCLARARGGRGGARGTGRVQ